MIKVNFVSQGGPSLASHRFRVVKPCELLNRFTGGFIDATTSVRTENTAAVNIYNKHFDQRGNILSAHSGPDLGYKTVFDVCDNHFESEDKKMADYYMAMCLAVDVVTCNTANMQEAIYEHTGVLAKIIPDPISFPSALPKHNTEPKLLWYGHTSNFPALIPWLDTLDQRVTVVCDQQVSHPKADWIQWRPNLVEAIIKDYDIVLLPTDLSKESHKCKSPNRAVDAINAGKLVITNNKDIYESLLPFLVYADKLEYIRSFINAYSNPDFSVIADKIEKGQKFIRENFNDDVILRAWLGVFKDLGIIKDFKQND